MIDNGLAIHLRRFADRDLWPRRTMADRARDLAAHDAHGVMLVDGGVAHEIGTLLADAEALAAAMAALGVRPGEVVSFQAPNWHETAVINLAACIGGFVVNPIVPIYRDAEVGYMLRDSRSRLLFLAEQFRGYDYAAMIARLAPDLPDLIAAVPIRPAGARIDDYAALVESGRGARPVDRLVDPAGIKLLLYTSGTTGRPKAVLHSHDTLGRVMEVSSSYWGIEPGDAILMPSPVTHISGYANGLEMPFLAGTRTILMESWNAAAALDLIGRHAVVGTVAATPFLQELAATAADAGSILPSLRFFACGGAAVPPELVRTANARFGRPVAFRVYGSSEAPLVTLGFREPGEDESAATTDGRVVDYEVHAVDADGAVLPPGEEGELLVRGPSMFVGYADPADTEAAIDPDGFLRTGDIGTVSADGVVTITDRKKDLIIRGGENISAREIEDALHRHPAVAEAAVVAMPHPRLGEGICAVLIAQGGERPDVAAFARHLGGLGLAKQKCPEHVIWVDDFPRTASGKVRKDRLRALAREPMAPSPD
jgi:acyl-CoA synthetase (AMP-forming)/AMP-acid ligase II